MKGFLATFDTREYININNIQEVNTYCYNNIHNPDILLFRESKVTEYIVLDYGADGFYIECSPELRKLFLNTRMTLKEFLNIPNTQFSVCLNIAEKDLKYLIMDDLTPLGVDIKELRNIVIFYNDCWGEDVAAFILYRVLGCITSLDTEDLDYCLEQYVGKVCDEDYFTLFTKQLNIVIDPLLEDYVDYRSYIIEHFTLVEYKNDIYVFNLY